MTEKIIVIDGYIGPWGYSKQFIRNELASQSKNPVTVKISSLGGAIDDALSIFDQFVEHGNITAVLSAFVASSATLISLGAKTVRMNENSFYLIHKAMAYVDDWGKMNEDQIADLIAKLEINKQQLAKVTLQMAKMYATRTGKTIEEILNLMKEETWLTAQEALDWGFVDEIFTPAVIENYLDNLQMVALINANDFPPVPAKKVPDFQNKVSSPENTEDSLFEKIWKKLIAKGVSVTPKNKVEMKKTFLNINSVLNIETMESVEEGVFLNEDQLEAIENRIVEIQQTINERDAAVTERDTVTNERDTAIAERDTAITGLAASLNFFNEIHATIADASTPESKAIAIRTLLSKVPGTTVIGIQGSSDKIVDEADWDTINDLQHNKQVDQNS